MPIARLALASALAAAVLATPGLVSAQVRGQIGLSALSDIGDLTDKIRANNPLLDISDAIPIGVSGAVTYRFNEAVSAGFSIGPIIAAFGDVSFTLVPLGLDVRYSLAVGDGQAVRLRLGAEQLVASGDLIENGKAGVMAGVGLHFAALGQRGWGVELAYRSAEVDIPGSTPARRKTSQPYKTTLSVYYAF